MNANRSFGENHPSFCKNYRSIIFAIFASLISFLNTNGQNLAQGKTAIASSYTNSVYQPSKAVDGDLTTTRWTSNYSDNEWIYVDLGQSYDIGEVVIEWQTAYGTEYDIQVSNDASSWTTIYSETSGDGGTDEITGLSATGRYVRMLGIARATTYGYSIWEFEVYEATSGGGSSGISEDFASSASNFTTVAGGTWSVSSGRYVLSSPADSGSNGILGNISVHNSVLSGDYELSALMRITGTTSAWNDAAIIFDYQDQNNYYYVSLNESNDSYTKGIFKVVSGSATELADFGSTITADTDYTIEIDRSGTSIVVRLNSTQIASITDATFSGGQVGFGSKNDGAQFDDLVVTGSTTTATEVIVDNLDAEFDGTWNTSTSYPYYYSTDYKYNASGSGSDKMRWRPDLTAGTYEVSIWLPDGESNRASNAPFTVYYNGGSQTYSVNEQGTGGAWVVLGSHDFASGTSGYVELTDNANNTWVIGDAVKFTPITTGSQVAAPAFSPAGGTYSSAQSVSITTSTSGATIRYTTDGSTPSSTSGTVYSSSISVSASTTLKAIAYKSGMTDSSVSSASYTISTSSSSGFGPDGTHWPSLIDTPYMYDTGVANIIEVACSWSAISSAISSVTSTQANAGVLILVQPGTLTGNGAGSGSTPVLQDLGSSSWTKRVTVAPRDGWGSVTVSSGARIFRVKGVCFAGFDFASLAFHANDRSAVAWSRIATFFSANGYSGMNLTDNEFVEVVIPDSALGAGDTADLFSYGAASMTGYVFSGCYFAPRYRPSGSSAHTDTLQFEPTSGGSDISDVYIVDCVLFSSSNCAIQTNAIDGLTVENCYIAGGDTAKTRYPFMTGAYTGGANNCFNGGGTDMTALDSYFIGGISAGSTSWVYAENTRTTYTGSTTPVSGSWIVDSTLDETNPTMPPYPTTTYLDSIWNP